MAAARRECQFGLRRCERHAAARTARCAADRRDPDQRRAARQWLPLLAPYHGFGAMLSYGPDVAVIFRRAAEFVAKILDGAPPGELPMEQPTRFGFVVNLRLARAMGLNIPREALLRANEVVE